MQNLGGILRAARAVARRALPLAALGLLVCSGCGRRAEPQVSLPDSTLILTAANAPDPNAPVGTFLQLESPLLAAGEKLAGSVITEWGKDEFRMLWIDGENRVVDAFDVVPQKKQTDPVPFELALPAGALGTHHRLVLVRGKFPDKKKAEFRAIAQAEFRVPHLQRAPQDYLVLHGPAAAQTIGVLVPPNEHPLRTPEDFELDVETYTNSRDVSLFEREPEFFDDLALENARREIGDALQARAKAPPLFWSLGQDVSVTHGASPFDYDRADEALDIYRAWLAERYSSLQALNRQWGTQYESWDDVMPATTDNEKAAHDPNYAAALEAVKNGAKPRNSKRLPAGGENFSAWCDMRAFCDFAFARTLRELRTEAQSHDPGARCGLQNVIGPYAWGGWDLSELPYNVDWLSEHGSPATREIIRGIAPKVLCLTQFPDQPQPPLYRLWDRWLRGDQGCIIQTDDGAAAASGAAVAPLFGKGLTYLRNTARPMQDSIAIYHSPQSVRLHWMFDSEFSGVNWLSHDESQAHSALLQYEAWLLLLEDLGFAPRFVGPEQLLSGELTRQKTRILILPKVLSISDNEAAALRDFVGLGGTLIADGACGTFDDAGKRRGTLDRSARARGALDLEFGVGRRDFETHERNGAFTGKADAAQVLLRDATSGQAYGPASDELRVLEPGVEALGAVTHASSRSGAAALLNRTGGLGRYIYLNLCLQNYPQLRAKKTLPNFQFHGMSHADYLAQFGAPTGGEALRLIVGDVITEVLSENPVRVLTDAGTPLRGVKRARFSLGNGAELLGLLPLGGVMDTADGEKPLGQTITAPTKAWLALPKAQHLYNVRTGEYLGHETMVAITLQPSDAVLLAALPYKLESFEVKVRRMDPRGQFKLTATLPSLEKSAVHGLQVEVFDPAGKLLPHYSGFDRTENGVWKGGITLALNDPAGNYRVVVRDLVTGVQAEGQLLKELQEYAEAVHAPTPEIPADKDAK